MPVTTTDLIATARRLGAVAAGVSEALPFDDSLEAIRSAVEAGRAGPLRFTYDDPERATNVRASFPWADRLLTVAVGYGSASTSGDDGAFVGRFAVEDKYEQLRTLTGALADRLRAAGHHAEILIDDNRLVDRAAAVRSGVGWWGRSTMVLTPGHGPWILLGTVVTDAPLDTTDPMVRDCGTCTACLPACPTGALSEAHGLDARRCLATWMQTPASLPYWIRPHLGTRIYGCDDCLTSCPPGQRILEQSSDSVSFEFAGLLALGDEALLERFGWWYVPRREGRFIRRNLLIAAGNSGDETLGTVLEDHLHHPSSLVRGHASWALAALLGDRARGVLRDRLAGETVQEARDELVVALLSIEWPTQHRLLLAADEWASTNDTIRGLALMGSHAQAGGTLDSDLDLLVLAAHPEQLIPPVSLGHPHRGLPVRLGRALGHQLRGEAAVDLVIGPLDWPTDDGGERALAQGIVPTHDPDRRLYHLRRARVDGG